ncbi:MAG TPA: phosphatase PAP2 family protein [Ktedonobacteraceae bacterium]
MDNTTGSPSTQTRNNSTLAASGKRQQRIIGQAIGFTLWGIGLLLFIVSCFVIHAHPQPYPIDITTTQTLQNLQDVNWADTILHFVGVAIDPITSGTVLALWVVALLLAGWVSRLRGRSPMRWWVSAIFLAVLGAGTFGLNQLIDQLVNRPRPTSDTAPIRHHTNLIPIPTYPSGHVEFAVVFYGFLLFLSFTKPVREWRYRWVLIPFQLYAVFDILTVGIARITELDHWLTDVLAAYFEGALYLVAFIFLYQWTIRKLEERRAKKLAEKSTQNQQA